MNPPLLMDRLRNSTLKPALLASVLCWLAFPPAGLWPLVWLAPVGWIVQLSWQTLPGQRPYRALWLAGAVFWLLTLHWIRLPHPLNYLAWPALAGYLGCYLPAFVALGRVGTQQFGLPIWMVAPVVWAGLDWVRGRLFTGFLMGSLAHTQVKALPLLQLADVLGEYGITFLIVLFASCLANMTMYEDTKQRSLLRRTMPLLGAVAVVLIAFYYGKSRAVTVALAQKTPAGPRIALIQGNTLAEWKANPNLQQSIMQEYFDLSQLAVQQSQRQDNRDVDLLIWPETTFRQALATTDEGYRPEPDRVHESFLIAAQLDLKHIVQETGAAILTGIDRLHFSPGADGLPDMQGFNSSVLVDKQGEIVGTYDKMHLVIMGEYVPFADWIPLLKRLTPMTGLATPGEKPTYLEFEGLTFCPNICFETCVPHLIRRHMRGGAKPPDVLVNLTNDSWFWGSSELDMHLACGVLRAIETRTPLVIAANGGLSAHVDAYGTVRQVSPRQQTATLLVDLKPRGTPGLSFYTRYGDWFAVTCVVCCVVLAVVGAWQYRRGQVQSD